MGVKQQYIRWVLLVLIVGMLTIGFWWLNGVPGTTAGDRVADRAGVPALAPGQKKVVLEQLGMACPLCRAAVSSKLGRVEGVIAYEVNLRSDSATVLYDPHEVSIDDLKQAIAAAGYQVREVQELKQ